MKGEANGLAEYLGVLWALRSTASHYHHSGGDKDDAGALLLNAVGSHCGSGQSVRYTNTSHWSVVAANPHFVYCLPRQCFGGDRNHLFFSLCDFASKEEEEERYAFRLPSRVRYLALFKTRAASFSPLCFYPHHSVDEGVFILRK